MKSLAWKPPACEVANIAEAAWCCIIQRGIRCSDSSPGVKLDMK